MKYFVQAGRITHPQFVKEYDTEAKARAGMRQQVDQVATPFRKLGHLDTLQALDDLRTDIEATHWSATPVVFQRQIEGVPVYWKIWSEQ